MEMNNQEAELLTKVYFEYRDITGETYKYQQEALKGRGLEGVTFPFATSDFNPESFRAVFFGRNNTKLQIDKYDPVKYLINLKKMASDSKKDAKKSTEMDTWRSHQSLLSGLSVDYFSEGKRNFPEVELTDVTEQEMFGENPIKSDALKENQTGGIFSMHGFRKFRFKISNLYAHEHSVDNLRVSLYWDKMDSEDLDQFIFEDVVRYDIKASSKENDEIFLIAYIDTNRLGAVIYDYREKNGRSNTSSSPVFRGRFELHFTDSLVKNIYSFPVAVCVHDMTDMTVNAYSKLSNDLVSIDFGTSSTCAAIDDHLITLSGPGKRNVDSKDNPYENPTNLMIYDWDRMYPQWDESNENPPFFIARQEPEGEVGYDRLEAEYDSGYTVDDEYKDVYAEDGQRKMAAIMRELKMIPYFMERGKTPKFIPYRGERADISLTDSLATMSKEKMNPIALYGYLLGRAINNPTQKHIYTKYQISYPVKFDEGIKTKIAQSLTYGLRRSLPLPIQEANDGMGNRLLDVRLTYTEPECCLGAIVGRQLSLSQDDTGKLVAIYDLGGGTLDFAFAIFRNATDEEIDETDNDAPVIEILGVGGNPDIGGEKLIHKLAYFIYTKNREIMENNRIKFILPMDERPPEGFEGILLESESGDAVANLNVHLLKENVARMMFTFPGKKGETIDTCLQDILEKEQSVAKYKDTTKFSICLQPDNSKELKEVELDCEGIDEYLKENIEETVEEFELELGHVMKLEKNKDALDRIEIHSIRDANLNIFLGGNASKQHYVMQLLQEKFKNATIQRIGEGTSNANENRQFELNEKTAVAFGQLRLGAYQIKVNGGLEDDTKVKNPPFQYYVLYKDPRTEQYVYVIEKNESSQKWKKANRLHNELKTTQLYFTTKPNPEEKDLIQLAKDLSSFVEGNKMTLYIRPYDEDSIEFRLGKLKEPPVDDEPRDEKKVIPLVKK